MMFSSVGRSPAPPRTAAQRRNTNSSTRSRLSAGTLRSERRKSMGETPGSSQRPNRSMGGMGSLGPTSTSMTLQQSRPRSMGAAGGSALAVGSRGLASRGGAGSNVAHDFGATQSLPGTVGGSSGATLSTLGLGGAGKSVWRLPPVSHQASAQPTVSSAPVPAKEEVKVIMRSAASNIPHPAKMATGGEDANFISDSLNACGVADGVGGWTAHGIDAGEYARGLMSAAKEAVDVHHFTDPLAVLWHAYRDVSSLGSSTCLIMVLDPERGILHSANLGDSGFRVIRNSACIYRCKMGQHYFNCPYQLGSHSSDLPSDAMRHSMNVQNGDIIVSGSDGLFDNLFDADIVAIANEYKDDIEKIAQNIAQAARQASGNTLRQGPFALEAIANGIQFQGGKYDDVTVVVSRIETQQSAAVQSTAANPNLSATSAAPATATATAAAAENPPSRGLTSASGPASSKWMNSEERKSVTSKTTGSSYVSRYRDAMGDRDAD